MVDIAAGGCFQPFDSVSGVACLSRDITDIADDCESDVAIAGYASDDDACLQGKHRKLTATCFTLVRP